MATRAKTKAEKIEASDPFFAYFSIGEAIATLLHPFAEVVLHDLRTGRIVRIWNSFSDRQAGDLSHLDGAKDLFPENESILGPYEKALPSLGRTKSITAGLRGADGELIGFLCTNLDVSVADNAISVLQAFASPELRRPDPLYKNDLQAHIDYLVRDFSIQVNKPIDNLSRQERVELVAAVDRDGLFQARNAVKHVAKAMKISRASVYNLLTEVNRSGSDETPAPLPGSARASAATRKAAAQTAAQRPPKAAAG
ncbi:helix-turn-helix transcriptional regulator [Sphingopyxis panaciterrae]